MEAGLTIFVFVLVLNATALLFDAVLKFYACDTVSDIVRRQPLLAIPIIGLQVIGIYGLTQHFLPWNIGLR